MSADLHQLAELIDRLNSTPVQNRETARAKNKEHSRIVFDKMMNGGGTFGESSGTMPWLNGPNAPEALRLLNDDLSAQIGMVNHILDNWFELGEPAACHYPNRVAIILRKMKRGDLEREFLLAYARHFILYCYGVGHEKFNERIRKVIGDKDADAALYALDPLYVPNAHLGSLKITVKDITALPDSDTNFHINYQFKCIQCDGTILDIPDERTDESLVSCKGCGIFFGWFRELHRRCNELGTKELKRLKLGAFA